MTFREYQKLCESYGLTPYDNRNTDLDYGYWVKGKFYVVCGYRSVRKGFEEGAWRDNSLIFYGHNSGMYEGKFFTQICDRLKEKIENEISYMKEQISNDRIKNISEDFQ